MVVTHAETEGLSDEGETIGGEAKRPAGQHQSAQEPHRGPLDAIRGAGVSNDPNVEAGIVCDDDIVPDVVDKRWQNLAPTR